MELDPHNKSRDRKCFMVITWTCLNNTKIHHKLSNHILISTTTCIRKKCKTANQGSENNFRLTVIFSPSNDLILKIIQD